MEQPPSQGHARLDLQCPHCSAAKLNGVTSAAIGAVDDSIQAVSGIAMLQSMVEGELQLGERTVRKGHYFFVPAGYAMPAMSTTQGALV